MVDDKQGFFRRAHLAAAEPQAFERLRAGDFMNKVAVDIEKRRAVGVRFDDVFVPDFIVKGAGFRLGHGGLPTALAALNGLDRRRL